MGLKITKKAVKAVAQKQVVDADDEVAKAGQGSTSKQFKDGSMVDTNEQIPTTIESTDMMEAPAYVSVSIGLTKNLGNYESVKFHVAITLPCPNDADEIDETYTQARAWVDAKIESLNEEVDANASS